MDPSGKGTLETRGIVLELIPGLAAKPEKAPVG